MSEELELASSSDHDAVPPTFIRRLAASIHTPCRDRKRIKLSKPSDSDSGSSDLSPLEEVCGRHWKMFRVSLLHNFASSPIQLKKYGKKLREYLSLLMNRGECVEYKAEFSLVQDLRQTPGDKEAVRVLVKCSKNGEEFYRVYEGLFISWGSTHPPSNEKGVVSLPILLTTGTAGLTNAVHRLIGQFFDCSISRLILSEEEIFWLSAMLPAVCSPSRKNVNVDFHYSVPGLSLPGNLTFFFLQQRFIDIWNSLHQKEKEEIMYHEITTLHNGLKDHVFYVYKINLDMCRLERILSRDVYLASDGALKLHSTTLADKVLNFVCCISVIIDSTNPSLSAPDE